MGVLPNGYKPAVALGSWYASSSSTNAYFDTGVYPKDTLRIESVFEGGGQVSSVYFFGARNTNSTTSNGQIGFGANTDGNPIIAYNNAQSTVFTGDVVVGNAFYGKEDNELTYYTGYLSKTLVGSETAFTGTRTMYILARNNAGSPQYGGYTGLKRVRGVRIWDDGVLIREYLPAYEEATGNYGLYETVSASFVLKTGGNNDFIAMRPFTVSAAEGGDAVIDDERFGEVKEILVFEDSVYLEYVKVKAIPQTGYVFDYWEDNGTVVSRESELYYGGDIDEMYFASNLTAHFVKKTDVRQDNGFRAMFFPYGGTAEGERDQTTNIFAKIKSASIVEDMMGRSVSTIVLDKMPASITTDMPIIITDQLHKQVFIGIVKAINGDAIGVYEPLSILDTDFFMDTDDFSGYSITLFVERVLNQTILGILKLGALTKMNPFVVKKWSSFEVDDETYYIYLDKRLNNLSNAPAVTSAEVVNAEDYILNLANDFVIVVKPKYLQNRDPLQQYWQWGGQAISLDVVNPNLYTKLTFGNNSEEISNISIDVAEAEYTVLQVYNEAGTTLRGIYAVKNDGTIAKVSADIDINTFPADIHDFIANENCKVKVVNSNEQILLLKSQYLSNSFLNHKITFDVDLTTGVFRLEDFELGRPVDFYYGNKLYKSMVTAREYYITEDNDDITTVHITLGRVRQSLTTKMNMRKKK